MLLTARRVAWICERTGACVVGPPRRWRGLDGRRRLAWSVSFPSHAAKLKGLNLLARIDSRCDPRLREVAVEVASHAAPGRLALAKFCHAFVQACVRFTGEARETFASAYDTIRTGVGDCDDSAEALCALWMAVGFQARVVGLGRTEYPTHAAAQVNLGTRDRPRWVWGETTIAARFGEHPYVAKARLGTRGRGDI